MARIEGEIIIGRPVEAVFDFAADQRNEPRYNPRMIRADKVSDGPVPAGTRMRWSWSVRPKGAARLLGPAITWIGRRQEQAIRAGTKQRLETRDLGHYDGGRLAVAES